jgi:hypothetical protein
LIADLNEHYFNAGPGTVILRGPDCKWNPFDSTSDQTHVMAVSLPQLEKVYMFHLTAMGVTSPETCPQALKQFFGDKRLRATNVNIGTDLARMKKLGIHIEHWLDLQHLSRKLNPDQSAKLNELCRF